MLRSLIWLVLLLRAHFAYGAAICERFCALKTLTVSKAGILLLVAAGTLGCGAFAQEADPQQARQPDPAKNEKTVLRTADWLDISFSARLRCETLDNRFRFGEVGSDQQLPQRTRIGVGIKEVIDPLRFHFEFEDSRIHLNDSGSVITTQMVDEHDILQLYVSLVFNQKPGSGLPTTISFGRQSFDLGNRRLFAYNRYRNTTNRWDGLRWSIGAPKKWNLDTFFFIPVRIQMYQMDRRVKGAYFWGGYFSKPWKSGVNTELYYFGLWEDPNLAQSTKRRFTTIGGRLFKDTGPKVFGYEVESAWQFGRFANFDHFAHFQHLQLTYTFDARWQPSVSGLYDYAAGDKDPNDNRSDNFDPLFGARRFEYGPTGIYQWMSRTNISSPALYFALKPVKRFEFMPNVRWQWLAQARAPWAGGLLRDPTGRSGAYVGNSMEWRLRYTFASYFRPEIGYVRFFKGRFAK
jgi:hypothetical protein